LRACHRLLSTDGWPGAGLRRRRSTTSAQPSCECSCASSAGSIE
jgi:hypothetical protein